MEDEKYSFHSLFSQTFWRTNAELGRDKEGADERIRQEFLSRSVSVSVKEIVIPKIQRDYAQGRLSREVDRVRKDFIGSLKQALVQQGRACSLNFIYGQLKELQKGSESVAFIPLDGQQRLTTLYLLHWYLSRLEGRADSVSYLKGFRYDTRYSSSGFTTIFLDRIRDFRVTEAEAKWLSKVHGISCADGDVLPAEPSGESMVFTEWLLNKSEFASGWQRDPTIAGMLVMLQTIHREFRQEIGKGFLDRLQSDDDMPIYFYLQFMDANSDSGDVFIKMNSRGKLLTEYEYFKADFQKMLGEGGVADREEISERMDRKWERTFWRYAKTCQDGGEGLKTAELDKYLIRYVNFCVDVLGIAAEVFEACTDSPDAYQHDRLYAYLHVDGVLDGTRLEDFLGFFDCWCNEEAQNIYRFFDGVFSDKAMPGKVRLFADYKDGVQLLKKVLLHSSGGLNQDTMIVLYSTLLAFSAGMFANESGRQMFDFRIRMIRNLSFSMDKGYHEIPYNIRSARWIMLDGAMTGLPVGAGQKSYVDQQVREEKFKKRLQDLDPAVYAEVRLFEESDWLKGRVGVFCREIYGGDQAMDDTVRKFIMQFSTRKTVFQGLFGREQLPTTGILREALFRSTNVPYFVKTKKSGRVCYCGSYYGDFGWTADRPYFTRDGESLAKALGALLDNEMLRSEILNHPDCGADTLIMSYLNERKNQSVADNTTYDAMYYMGKYYDRFFELWVRKFTKNRGCMVLDDIESMLNVKCLEKTMKSAKYWDPYLYTMVSLAVPDFDLGESREFANCIDKGHKERFAVLHTRSGTLIWNENHALGFEGKKEHIEALLADESNMEVASASGEGRMCARLQIPKDGRNPNADSYDRIAKGSELMSKLISM